MRNRDERLLSTEGLGYETPQSICQRLTLLCVCVCAQCNVGTKSLAVGSLESRFGLGPGELTKEDVLKRAPK